MYKVKLTTGNDFGAINMIRQTAGGKAISSCGKYQFYIGDDVKDPDFWVVRNKLLKDEEVVNVAPENTILVISEPKSIISFPKKYTDQFGVFCSCQDHLKKRKNIRFTIPVLPWFVGFVRKNGKISYTRTYDDLKNASIPNKTKLISVITSDKAFTQGHQDRIDFVEKLKEHYGDKLDVFGRGFNEFDDKWDVLAPYKYHIALENSSSKFYWTEKLADCYLAGTFPIYYGCTNLQDYFPKESFAAIDIYDFAKAVELIDSLIANEEYAIQKSNLQKCKDLVLDDYNMFNVIASICDGLEPNLPKKTVKLIPAKNIFDYEYHHIAFLRGLFNIKKALRKILKRNSVLKSL